MSQARQLTERLKNELKAVSPVSVSASVLDEAVTQFREDFDERHGGFGSAPKFPPSAGLSLLLRCYRRTGESRTLQMVTRTLDAMAAGGIYDHIGGGFARYSTDERWLVPHFEKMLYDNALLARTYLDAYQVTKQTSYRPGHNPGSDRAYSPPGDDRPYRRISFRDGCRLGRCRRKVFCLDADGSPGRAAGDAEGYPPIYFCAYYDITDQGSGNIGVSRIDCVPSKPWPRS